MDDTWGIDNNLFVVDLGNHTIKKYIACMRGHKKDVQSVWLCMMMVSCMSLKLVHNIQGVDNAYTKAQHSVWVPRFITLLWCFYLVILLMLVQETKGIGVHWNVYLNSLTHEQMSEKLADTDHPINVMFDSVFASVYGDFGCIHGIAVHLKHLHPSSWHFFWVVLAYLYI